MFSQIDFLISKCFIIRILFYREIQTDLSIIFVQTRKGSDSENILFHCYTYNWKTFSSVFIYFGVNGCSSNNKRHRR